MLIKKFLARNNLTNLSNTNPHNIKHEQALLKIVTNHYDGFISEKQFTDKNLKEFEE